MTTARRFSPFVLLAAWACAQPQARKAPQATAQHFAGRVVHADGDPASGAIIIISDASKGDMLLTVRAAEDGTFATALPLGVYALTATDADGAVYIPSVDARRGPVEVALDPSCHKLQGRIRTTSPIPESAVVRVTRFSDEIADEFGAAVAADGAFRACVPSASYAIYPPDGFVVRNAIAVVPYARVFEYRTDAQTKADHVPADLRGIKPESADEFVATFPSSTKVLGLGESNHGTREFYVERTALALRLASKRDVRLLMIEAGYGEVLALDDYVAGGVVEIERAVEELGYWMWDTKTFIQALVDIRNYNATVPADKRIHLIGFDVQDTGGAIKYLRERTKVMSTEETRALDKLAFDDGKAWTSMQPADRATIRAALDRVAATRGVGSASSSRHRAALAARSLLLRLDMLEAGNKWHLSEARDAGMARMVLEVLAIEPRGRVMLWGHLGHLSREYVVGQSTMGAHLSSALGDSYRIYGLFAVGGSARAWDYKGEVGVIASPLRAAPAYSLEGTLAAQSGGAPVSYWTFANATGKAAQWLQGVHALRAFGAVFLREGHEFTYWDLQSFDGAILFDSVSPTEPTPTGERHAKSKQ